VASIASRSATSALPFMKEATALSPRAPLRGYRPYRYSEHGECELNTWAELLRPFRPMTPQAPPVLSNEDAKEANILGQLIS
jgi:hypothetical protein